ncbi:hypothetical protein [Actinomadura keratinilytica]|uniref:hypothetical protein n=1 Tax=Actinomadura keratinilytica TaxID=547461 RepID=UPI003615AC1F
MTRRNSCAHCPGSHSGERPCLASATTKARAWLLVEHPGPWPERVEQDLPGPAAISAAVRAAQAAGVRPQLIRRSGRRRRIPPVQVYVGYSHGERVWLEGRELADPAELADLDLAAVAAGRSPGSANRSPTRCCWCARTAGATSAAPATALRSPAS